MTEQRFAHSGTLHFSLIERLLRRHGGSFYTAQSVLDWGCGVGRLGRLFAGLDCYTGCDINAPAISYLRDAMRFGDFRLTGPRPPLPFEDNRFDVAFSLSVLTHLSEPSMHGWLAELHRVLKPGGLLVQTTLGRKAMHAASAWPGANRAIIGVDDEEFAELSAQFAAAGWGWVPHMFATATSADYGIAVQTEKYIAERWTEDLHLLEVVAGGIDDWQDLVILQKPESRRGTRPVPVFPIWPQNASAGPATAWIETTPYLQMGVPAHISARASEGTDVHYRFGLDRPLLVREYLTGWQSEPQITLLPWWTGPAELIVEAASGVGYHCAAATTASALVKVG